MKKLVMFTIILCSVPLVFAQNRLLVQQGDFTSVPPSLSSKLWSGELLYRIAEKNRMVSDGTLSAASATTSVVLYFDAYPTAEQIVSMENLGVRCHWETWTPPLPNHPRGFVLATLPVRAFVDALSLGFVVKMGTGESPRAPMNNEAARAVAADSSWYRGWKGNGAKVALLDSGLDTDPQNPDLPVTFQARDYSQFPNAIGTTVLNKVSGHGTHTTATVLGRGTLSSKNSSNGSGSFQGIAPEASLVFLKIGGDTTSNSTSAADIAAMHAAVDTFHANALSMSYGGWDAYHDGSDAEDQVVDWVYSKGVPFFLSAGNDGTTGRHFSGTVAGHDSSALITVSVTGAGSTTKLRFNLVWWVLPPATPTSLYLVYYDESMQPLSIRQYTPTTSSRGTTSSYSQYNYNLPSGISTYYLRVINTSAQAQKFHIYEDWRDGHVQFPSYDPTYTIGSPSSADHGFSIAAFVSRKSWLAFDGTQHSFGSIASTATGDIAPFSSRGPRVDGVSKPDIAAPGSALVSLRDRHVYTSPNLSWIASSSQTALDTAYYVMQGTSMACPVAAGSAALLLGKNPTLGAQQVYDALSHSAIADGFTGNVPNLVWGAGKLNVNAALNVITGIQYPQTSPTVFVLYQNYPNPFNPTTIIAYTLPRTVRASLVVYDVLGQIVSTLVDETQREGFHQVSFDATGLASGVYFYRLRAGSFVEARRLLLLR